MLESRVNRELCRNGEPLVREVRYSCQKPLEQEQVSDLLSLTLGSRSIRAEGVFMKPNLAEVLPFQGLSVPELETGPGIHAVPAFPGQLEITPPTGVLSLVPNPIDTTPSEAEPARLNSADAIPELFAKRVAARERAARILAQNSYLLHNGRPQEVPGASDPLGTAKQVVAVEKKFGTDSPEHKEVSEGLDEDNGTLLGEVATANQAVHFRRVRRIFKGADHGYFAKGLSISTMADNGLSPLAKPEEQPRRITEAVEEHGTLVPIGGIIAERGLKGMVELLTTEAEPEPELPTISVQVTTVSRCPLYAIEDHKLNPKDSHGGLRPAMEGMAIRRYHFEDDTGDREDEQVIISGKYITKEVVEAILVEDGVIEPGQELTVDEMLAMQLISINGGDVMNFVQRLDNKAGEVHGINIFMGEEVPADHPKDYGQFMEESEEQRNKLEPLKPQLAKLQIGLEKKGADDQLAEALINKFLKTKLLALSKNNPELAAAIFDKVTADGFAQVARLEAAGRTSEARVLQAQVEKNAPEVSYCSGGGGGCKDLESIDPQSPIGRLAVELGLKGAIVRNLASACPDCHTMGLVHDYHGNTACAGCKASKLSGQNVQHDNTKEKSSDEDEGQTTQEANKVAPLISLDDIRSKSEKAAERKLAPLPQKAGEVVMLNQWLAKQVQTN